MRQKGYLTSQALVSSLQTIGFFLINDLEAMLLCDNKMASTVALERNNISVTVRRSRGKDIDAACGQLANKN